MVVLYNYCNPFLSGYKWLCLTRSKLHRKHKHLRLILNQIFIKTTRAHFGTFLASKPETKQWRTNNLDFQKVFVMFFMTCKIVYYPDNVIAGTAIFIYWKHKERMFFDQGLIKIYLRLDFRVHQGMKVSSLRLMTSSIKY